MQTRLQDTEKEQFMSKKCLRFSQEYVEINGIKQYFLHYPSQDGEVVLTLHGGPGQSEALFAHYAEEINSNITSVYYDQRGAGKTLMKNRTDVADVTLAQLSDDLHKTVAYIKTKYQKDKIVLAGHSWGSILGLTYAKLHPEDLLCYVGGGQIINMRASERLLFERLRDAVRERKSPRDGKLIDRVGNYPYNVNSIDEFSSSMKIIMRLRKKYGLVTDFSKIKKIAAKSPIFAPSDIIAMIRAQKLSRNLLDALKDFNAESITAYDVPIYFIHGTADLQVSLLPAETYLGRISAPDKAFYPIEGAGHIVNMDDREACASVMREILSKQHRISDPIK
jgi:pimeloyl-ACP methyl ester carboxylesterase